MSTRSGVFIAIALLAFGLILQLNGGGGFMAIVAGLVALALVEHDRQQNRKSSR